MAENALYFGGDVGDGTVSFLHGSELVRGSAEVLPGVYLGGYDSACELVKDGDIAAKDFKFFARYCGWGPGQLESECARGVWYPVACSKQLALKQAGDRGQSIGPRVIIHSATCAINHNQRPPFTRLFTRTLYSRIRVF